ncbi:helix-turn-helix domain-containing protein [Thiothrix winogradskyi]|uniref:Helix-turn-helix domain-containing protein n=1 Tax=Thiothrix winogradskyi TaxID=96472 RepID=A0ABY3SWN4_9GAMM|nr:helix-turn-helix domain-containing protein [Thiothrix winogradskyi]UJS23901.1 helix-turn-helix domain-containing protein [Thiothrix winogradskyi]
MIEDSFSITRAEAARYLSVSPRTVETLGLPYQQIRKRGRVLYRQSDLEKVKRSSQHNMEVAA